MDGIMSYRRFRRKDQSRSNGRGGVALGVSKIVRKKWRRHIGKNQGVRGKFECLQGSERRTGAKEDRG